MASGLTPHEGEKESSTALTIGRCSIPARSDAIAAMLGRISLRSGRGHSRQCVAYQAVRSPRRCDGAKRRRRSAARDAGQQATGGLRHGICRHALGAARHRPAAHLLAALPDWRLDLYGECRYKGERDQPAPELSRLLTEFTGRVAWHGVVSREALATRLDAARVLLLPHRLVGAVRGDSMKLYDYAARGRPIVSTVWADDLRETAPPGTYFADAPPQFAEAVARAIDDDPRDAAARRAWAEMHSWASRWDAWSQAVFGAR